MKQRCAALLALLAAMLVAACNESTDSRPAAVKPALTVTAVKPQQLDWPQVLASGCNMSAW